MLKNTELILGQGIDQLKFGMTREDVEKILGKPNEIDKYNHSDEGSCITYYYDEIGMDCSFESEDEFRLSYMSVDSDEFHIKDMIRIGLQKNEIESIIEHLQISEPVIEDVSTKEVPDHEIMTFEDESLNLWFLEDELVEIQFGPFWKDDDNVIWPK